MTTLINVFLIGAVVGLVFGGLVFLLEKTTNLFPKVKSFLENLYQ